MSATKDRTILIVDDDADLRDAIAFDFKRSGYQILTAAGGHEAFQITERQKVDLVISDIHMPQGSGIELLDQIKKTNVHLPVFIFISCSSELDLSAEEAYSLGADAVFSKPFDRKELLSAVVNALLPAEERLQRKDPRLDLESPIGVKFLRSNFTVQAKALNIARGGMFVALHDQFPVVPEEVEFHLKETPHTMFSFRGSGIVRWVRQKGAEDFPPGCGVEFSKLDNANVMEIIAAIGKQKHRSFIPRK